MGHTNPKGLANAVRGFLQRTEDPLFMEFEEGPLVAAKRIIHLLYQHILLLVSETKVLGVHVI